MSQLKYAIPLVLVLARRTIMKIRGGPNEKLVEHFGGGFADIAFRSLGDRVEKWITSYEPWVSCVMNGYIPL